MQLHFRKLGNGSPIIILHGLYGSSSNWLKEARTLQENHTVYVVDLRNHGNSPHSADISFELMAQDVYELIQHENLSKVTIVGHSMGGRVAMHFAQLYQDLIHKLIIVDIAPEAEKVSKYSLQNLKFHTNLVNALQNLPIEKISNITEANNLLEKDIPELAIRQFVLKNLKKDENKKYYWLLNIEAIKQNLEKLILDNGSINTKINCPTLFIKGELSPYIQPQNIELIKTIFPNVELKTIQGANHWVHKDKPNEFMSLIVNTQP